MNYRDERDALRGRIEGLEQDLQDARRSQEDEETKRARVAQIEARMRETEDNLKAMRAELEALGGGTPRPKPKRGLLFAIAGMTFLGAALGALLLVRTPVTTKPVAAPPPIPIPEVPVIPFPGVPAREPVTKPAPLPPPEVGRRVDAQWVGQVTRANGLAAGAGAPCIVAATLESEGEKASVVDLSVKCGGKMVYQSSDKLEGMSMRNRAVGEEPGKAAGTFAYALKYSDTGARSGPRTQVSLDTTQGQGAVWSDVVPMFRVEFKVPALSTPIKGERLLKAKDTFQRFE